VPEIGVAELALDDHERYAFVGHLTAQAWCAHWKP
jgi:hypothetical protein